MKSMLQEEAIHFCPLGLSSACRKLESPGTDFSVHHIDGNSANNEYWNLIWICKSCHEYIDNKKHPTLKKHVRLKKRNLSLHYFGSIAINSLRLAYKHKFTSAMPAMVLKLVQKDFLYCANSNALTVGMGLHVTIQDYGITEKGRKLIEELIKEY